MTSTAIEQTDKAQSGMDALKVRLGEIAQAVEV